MSNTAETYTRAPVVWGKLKDGLEFWWCVELDRLVTRAMAGGKPSYDLLVGHLCAEHGLEHTELAGITVDLDGALRWLIGEAPMPEGPLLWN